MNKISTLFLILFNASLVVAQTLPNDCVRAITVCGNGTFFSNASGIGTVQEINGASCGGSESNSLWLKITIAASVIPGSTLGFNLIPDDPSTNVDYDFYVFPANAVCGALGNAIRCCTTNPGPAPFGAALSNNITGINGSTLQTAVGPGSAASSSGDDYVRWLTVSPGQTYYIAIDRPVGNGGFQIQWTGTATAGAGAFTTPPTANSIADLKTCSNTPNVGIFDLNSVRPLINSNLILNTISFHSTISNAIDNIAPLPNIYVNTSNPQTIYVRVTDNASKCFSTTSFNLVVNLVPNATLSVSNIVICNGDSVTVTYSGTPGATFDYTVGGGPIQTGLFPASGIFTITETLTSNRTYTLNGVRNLDSSGIVICNQPLNISRTVTVNQQPDAGQNGGLTLCASSLTPLDLFSIITGEQSGGIWTRTSGTGGVFDSVIGTFTPTAGATTSTFEYTLLGVAPCINDISVATITIGGQPDAGSNGITTICETNTTAIDLFSLITGEQAGGTWAQTSGTGGIFNAGAGTFTPAVGATNSTFTYTLVGVAPCITDVSTVFVSVVAQPTAPTASVIVQPTCTTSTGTIVVTAPTPAANITYILTGINPVAAAVTQSSATFSNLDPGVYDLTTTNTTTGCISSATSLTVNPIPSVAAPTVSATAQPTCTVPTATILVTAPTGANLEYSVNGTTYQASATFTGLTPNNYNVTVRNTTNGCVSTATVVIINAIPTIATPTASATVQPTCTTPTGTIVVTAPTGANIEYSVNGATYQASATFTGLTPNNYNVTVRNTTNGCVSTATVVTINAVPTIATPTASATVQPTCATPTGTIVVTAPTGANLEYSVNGATYQASATFTGLTPNNYNVTVRDTSNGCVSTATIVTINAVPTIAAPTASATVQPICTTPTGTIVVTAPTGVNFEYSVNGITYQASATFTGLTPNNYNVTVRNTTNGCVSTATIVTVNAIPTIATPTASATAQPTCTVPTATILVTAPTGANLEYSVNGTTYQASATFTGLTPNNYNVTVRNTTNGCVSTATVVIINAIPTIATPTASATVQPTCTTPTGTIVVTAPTGANIEYSVNGATYQASATFTGLTPNNYNVTVRNTTNGCVSTATVVTINAVPTIATPTASATVQPTCATPTGTIVVTAPTGANLEYSVNGATYQASATFTGLTPNNYNVTVRNTTNGCVSTTTVVAINAVPTIATPTASVTVQPTCTTPTGSIVVTTPTGANLEYSVNGATYQASATFTGLIPNNYNVTVRNTTNGCVSTATVVTINAVPTIATPTASATVQPTCTTPTGTIVVTAPTGANLEYSVNGATYQASATFTGLTPNNYNVTVRNTTNGCVSTATVVTINAVPTIAIPTASATVQPTCTTPTGIIVVTAPTGVNLEYSANGTTYQASATFTGFTPNNYNLTVRNTTNGCVSTTTIVTINAIPTVATPTASTTVQPTCTTPTGTIVVTAPTGANLEYSVNGATYQASAIFTGLTPNNYNVTVRNTTTGCISTATPLNVNPIPSVAVPTTTIQQPDCNILTGSIQVNSPLGASLEYSIDGIIFQASPNFTGLVLNNYTITVKDILNGCTNTTAPIAIVNSVNDVIVNINPSPLQDCDPNNDGFVAFDLTQIINSITGGNPSYNVTFHETITDANIDGTAVSLPTVYPNINPWTQIIYVRVESNTTSCFEVVPLQLIINRTPISPVNLNPITVCDQDSNPQDGITAVDLTQQESAILAQQPQPITSTFTISYYTSQSDAQTQTAAISNVTSYVTASDEIWIRIENSATNCFNTGSFQVVVNKPLSLNTPLPLSLCDNDVILNDQFQVFNLTVKDLEITQNLTGYSVSYYPSLLEAQNGANVILTPTAYQNAFPAVQTLGVVVTSSAGCTSITTLDIRVEPLPTLTPPIVDIEVCDENQDGFGGFNLNNLVPGLLNGITTYTVSFHETLTDAQLDINAIPTSVPYFSINPFVQIIYVRAEDTITGCWSTLPITLNVNPSPIAPINLNPIVVCDQDSNPQNASTPIDLTQQESAILAQQTGAASNYTVEYYSSQLLAEQGTSPIINNTNYIVSDGATIWIRVELIATGCSNIGSFQVVINKPMSLPNSLPPLSLCDVDTNPNNQFHIFDLTQGTTTLPLVTGVTVAYYPSLALAQAGVLGTEIGTPTAYTNILPGVQTLGVVVTTAAGCKSITTLDIRVLPIPTPRTNPPALAPKCDDNLPGDMLEVFNLTVNESYIRNGDLNLSFSYYLTPTDAAVPQNALPVPTAASVGTNVWIRVENSQVDSQGNNCYVLVEQPLTVNPLPIVVQPLAPYRACDDNTDGIAVFDLTNPQLAIAILGATQLPADYTISYYLTSAGANPLTNTGETPLPNSYTNVTSPNAQTIYIRVVNNTTGCVNTGALPLAVEPYATATGPQTFNQCDSYTDPYDGVELIDLTTYAPAILNGQDPTIFLVSYYTSLADAQAGTNALTLAEAQAYQTDADTDTIWVKVENSSNLLTPFCNAITTIDIKVERYPNPVINTSNNVTTICVDFITDQVVRPLTLNSGVTNPTNYTFQWFEGTSTTPIPGATGPSYTVDLPSPTGATRAYTVTVTSNSPLACQTTSIPFSVIQSGQAVVPTGTIGYTVTSAFSSLQTITVNIEGYGAPDYQYSLDDGPRQTSNVFENVSLGTHVIHVWDGKGDIAYSCEELIITDVQIIDYPHYFTPNGDGIHDTWNIVGLAGQRGAKIYIFDRYGKLLKQISSTGAGWDGTYNGYLMPSDDYWFKVDFVEGLAVKQFKAHFSLKR
jgi:large repetitive protein